MSTTSRGRDFKRPSLSLLVLLIVINYAKATIDYAVFRNDIISKEISRTSARTTRDILEELLHGKSSSEDDLQRGTEHLLQYGALLRTQILDTFGKLVYDHYDDFGMSQIEALYRIYRETLERKYNIFDIVPSVLKDPDTRPTKICAYINDHVRTCLKESSRTCMNVKVHNEPHQDTLSKRALNVTRRIYELTEIRKYYPHGFSPAAVLEYVKTGRIRFTPALFSGLLHNVQYDSFDDRVRTAERELVFYLTKAPSKFSRATEDAAKVTRSVSELLTKYLSIGGSIFTGNAQRHAIYLSEHVVREVDAISENIKLLGTVYDNSTFNLKYLFELILPNDTMDGDVLDARDYLLRKIRDNRIVDKYLRVERYQQVGPDQLLMAIFGQLRDIRFAEDIVTSLYAHARFWHKNHMIENVNELFELFDAYENLRGIPKYQELMKVADGIKSRLKNARNVTIELLCSTPRTCLRIGLKMIRNCGTVDAPTKKLLDTFIDQSCLCSCLEDDLSSRIPSSMELLGGLDAKTRNTSITEGTDSPCESEETTTNATTKIPGDVTTPLTPALEDNTSDDSPKIDSRLNVSEEGSVEGMTDDALGAAIGQVFNNETIEKSTVKPCDGKCSLDDCTGVNCTVGKNGCTGTNCSSVSCVGDDCQLTKNCTGSNCKKNDTFTETKVTSTHCDGSECQQVECSGSGCSQTTCNDGDCPGDDNSSDDCSGDDCSDSSEDCSGPDCPDSGGDCSGSDCSDRSDDCSGPDCSDSIEDCSGPDCSDESGDCSGPDCPDSSCEGASCEKDSTVASVCKGPDCEHNSTIDGICSCSNHANDTKVNSVASADEKKCSGLDCPAPSCFGSNCTINVTRPECTGPKCFNTSCAGNECPGKGADSGDCTGSDCDDESEVQSAGARGEDCEGSDCPVECVGDKCPPKPGKTDCVGENCTDSICKGPDCLVKNISNNCIGADCPRNGTAIDCEGLECPKIDNCTGSDCPNNTSCEGTDCSVECEGDDCSEECEGGNCSEECEGEDCSEECDGFNCPNNCTGPDCPGNATTIDCEGPKCPKINCTGPNCVETGTTINCTGSDCPNNTTVCEGDDCSEECEGDNCSDECEGDNCLEECDGPSCPNNNNNCTGADCPGKGTAIDCKGPSCPKINCTGPNCVGNQIPSNCTGSNCPNNTNVCKGDDCSEECNGDDCSDECEGDDCSEDCEGSDCPSNNCTGANCPVNSTVIDCKGLECPKINCTGAKCALNQTNINCTGSDCPNNTTDCEGDDCSVECEGDDCSVECEGDDCSTRCEGDDCSEDCEGPDCPDENCTGAECTPSTVSPVEERKVIEVTSPPPTKCSSHNTTAHPHGASTLCSKTDPHYRRQIKRLQKMRRIDADSSTPRSSYDNWSAIFSSVTEKQIIENNMNKNLNTNTNTKAIENTKTNTKTSGRNPLLQILGSIDLSYRRNGLKNAGVDRENSTLRVNNRGAIKVHKAVQSLKNSRLSNRTQAESNRKDSLRELKVESKKVQQILAKIDGEGAKRTSEKTAVDEEKIKSTKTEKRLRKNRRKSAGRKKSKTTVEQENGHIKVKTRKEVQKQSNIGRKELNENSRVISKKVSARTTNVDGKKKKEEVENPVESESEVLKNGWKTIEVRRSSKKGAETVDGDELEDAVKSKKENMKMVQEQIKRGHSSKIRAKKVDHEATEMKEIQKEMQNKSNKLQKTRKKSQKERSRVISTETMDEEELERAMKAKSKNMKILRKEKKKVNTDKVESKKASHHAREDELQRKVLTKWNEVKNGRKRLQKEASGKTSTKTIDDGEYNDEEEEGATKVQSKDKKIKTSKVGSKKVNDESVEKKDEKKRVHTKSKKLQKRIEKNHGVNSRRTTVTIASDEEHQTRHTGRNLSKNARKSSKNTMHEVGFGEESLQNVEKTKSLQHGWKKLQRRKSMQQKSTKTSEQHDNEGQQSYEDTSMKETAVHRGVGKERSRRIHKTRHGSTEWLEKRRVRTKHRSRGDDSTDVKKHSRTKVLRTHPTEPITTPNVSGDSEVSKRVIKSRKGEKEVYVREDFPLIYQANAREDEPWVLKRRVTTKTRNNTKHENAHEKPKRNSHVTSQR